MTRRRKRSTSRWLAIPTRRLHTARIACLAPAELHRRHTGLGRPAIDIDPSYERAYNAMSSVFNSQVKYDDAARTTEREVSINPKAWQGYFELAKAMLGKGLYQKAPGRVLGSRQYRQHSSSEDYMLVPLNLYKEAETELQAFLSHPPRGQDISSVKVLLAKVEAEIATAPGAQTATPGLAARIIDQRHGRATLVRRLRPPVPWPRSEAPAGPPADVPRSQTSDYWDRVPIGLHPNVPAGTLHRDAAKGPPKAGTRLRRTSVGAQQSASLPT